MKKYKCFGEKKEQVLEFWNEKYLEKKWVSMDWIPFLDSEGLEDTDEIENKYYFDKENLLRSLGSSRYVSEVEIDENNTYKIKVKVLKFRDLRKIETWKWMLEEGIIFDSSTVESAFLWAVDEKNKEVLQLLFDNCENIPERITNYVLYRSADNGFTDGIEIFFKKEKDAVIKLIKKEINTVLWDALTNNHLETLEYLLKIGGLVNSRRYSLLRYAISRGNIEALNLLFKYGANPFMVNFPTLAEYVTEPKKRKKIAKEIEEIIQNEVKKRLQGLEDGKKIQLTKELIVYKNKNEAYVEVILWDNWQKYKTSLETLEYIISLNDMDKYNLVKNLRITTLKLKPINI